MKTTTIASIVLGLLPVVLGKAIAPRADCNEAGDHFFKWVLEQSNLLR